MIQASIPKDFETKHPLQAGLLTDTLLEVNNPIVTEIFDVEYREKSEKHKKTGKVRIYDEKSQITVALLILKLMKELKFLVTEKHHFDYRDESFLETVFWKFWTIKVWMQRSISMDFESKPLVQE